MNLLPIEIIDKIFSYLPNNDILKFLLVSKKFHNITKNYPLIIKFYKIFNSLSGYAYRYNKKLKYFIFYDLNTIGFGFVFHIQRKFYINTLKIESEMGEIYKPD